jgi:hypothetical protein
MTEGFRIALIGLPEGPGAAIEGLFRDNGFHPQRFDRASVDLTDPGEFADFDLVVADASLAGGGDEERFFSFLLSTRGFLIFAAGERVRGSRGGLDAVVHDGSSLEEILAAAQDVLYGGAVAGVPPRKYPRIRVDLEVAFESGGARHDSRTRTLSENGAFIASLDPPLVGARVELSLALPAGRVAASGTVLYRIGYDLARGIISRPGAPDRKIGAFPGFGVVFDGIPEAGRDALRHFIEGKRYGG